MSHTKSPVFLLGGMRFKLSFLPIFCDECGAEDGRMEVGPLGMYGNELDGEWVALVPAADDQHLELERLKEQRDKMLAALKKHAEYEKAMDGDDREDVLGMLLYREFSDMAKEAISLVEGACVQQPAESETQSGLTRTDETEGGAT